MPVGGCGARAVSRKTPIYFMILFYEYIFWDTLYIKKIMGAVGFTVKDVVCLCSADSSAL